MSRTASNTTLSFTNKSFECIEFSLGSYNDPIPPQIPVVVPPDVPFQLVALALAIASIRSLYMSVCILD
jgi:hypothetical protein